jgi:hypothetical protein
MFKFILESFDYNFNIFNSRINLNKRNFEKNLIRFGESFSPNDQEVSDFIVKIPFGLVECFTDKCKKIRNNFHKLKFPTSKESLSFKFNFYKALCNLNIENNFNITHSEYFYMKKFKFEKPFKIIECDKNIGVCFIDTKLYNQFAIQQLNNKDIYLKLNRDPLKEVTCLIENKLKSLVDHRHISKKVFSKLINKNNKLGVFRLLAKLHKDKLGFRPIINCVNHPTMFLCLLIDLILQEFVKETSSFILDSQNLIQKSHNKYFPKNTTLYTCDFESLYSNIDLSQALTILTEFINKNFKSNDISTIGFHEILKMIFQNNVFTFNKKYFKQIKGIAMGPKCAPAIANLFLAILEENFLNIHKPLFYYRFIDDILLAFENGFNIEFLISSFDGLKLNVTTGTKVIFLDLIIEVDQITNKLSFSLYTKPTNTFSYLLSISNHPQFIFKNIPKSLFIRIRRICSKYSDYLFFANKLTLELVKRGYNKENTLKMAHSVSLIERSILLPYKEKRNKFTKEKIMFFKFPFDLNLPDIKLAFNTAFNSISSTKAWGS